MSDTLAMSGTYNDSVNGALDHVSKAAREGALDAREAADRFLSGAGLFVSRFAYTTCYTLSYGVVFPTTLIARSIPRNNAAVQGLIEGAKAATAKVEYMVTK